MRSELRFRMAGTRGATSPEMSINERGDADNGGPTQGELELRDVMNVKAMAAACA